MKYTAIKLKGLGHWLWFLTEKITETDDSFAGVEGWGKGGSLTAVVVDNNLIVGRINSEALQYVQ